MGHAHNLPQIQERLTKSAYSFDNQSNLQIWCLYLSFRYYSKFLGRPHAITIVLIVVVHVTIIAIVVPRIIAVILGAYCLCCFSLICKRAVLFKKYLAATHSVVTLDVAFLQPFSCLEMLMINTCRLVTVESLSSPLSLQILSRARSCSKEHRKESRYFILSALSKVLFASEIHVNRSSPFSKILEPITYLCILGICGITL